MKKNISIPNSNNPSAARACPGFVDEFGKDHSEAMDDRDCHSQMEREVQIIWNLMQNNVENLGRTINSLKRIYLRMSIGLAIPKKTI